MYLHFFCKPQNTKLDIFLPVSRMSIQMVLMLKYIRFFFFIYIKKTIHIVSSCSVSICFFWFCFRLNIKFGLFYGNILAKLNFASPIISFWIWIRTSVFELVNFYSWHIKLKRPRLIIVAFFACFATNKNIANYYVYQHEVFFSFRFRCSSLLINFVAALIASLSKLFVYCFALCTVCLVVT